MTHVLVQAIVRMLVQACFLTTAACLQIFDVKSVPAQALAEAVSS